MSLDNLFSMQGQGSGKASILNLKGIQISIASPEAIRAWSYGEVKKPETINYRTFKPERDGLFCAKIFGPVKDYECNCGKYKRMKHRGIVCEKCGVEVIAAKVRRERMGHIELAAPVAHIWFLKTLPSKIGTLLDMTMSDLEKVLYFDSWIVLEPGQSGLQKQQVLSEEQYAQIMERYENDEQLKIGMGAEAVRTLLQQLDLDALRQELRKSGEETKSQTRKKKITKRLKIVEDFLESKNRPEWMILEVIPVIPPDLRPLVPLDGGRFATSDLNDLYRRVINRNNRLKRLMELGAPEIIIRNEKRMLQEAVDALFDNGRRGRAINGTNGRPLKSLSDMIKGKQGRFRQNLLGKRVDYSGRSVITVGPNLKLHQCGLPKKMALELFKPFIYSELERLGHASTIKSAKKMVEREDLVVWDILSDVVREYPVLLNRAPTLHRLGIQAFEPLLVEGKAIRLHPLVCSAYNADFDGDQMAVHIPLSIEAQIECRVLMMSTNNILSPANGNPVIVPSQDIILGLYYMTSIRSQKETVEWRGSFNQIEDHGSGMYFCDPWEVEAAWAAGVVGMHARIKVRMPESGNICETTPGRIKVYNILPRGVDFNLVNQVLTKNKVAHLVDETYRRCGIKATVILCDKLKDMGYEFATRAGVTISVRDLRAPRDKEKILAKSRREVENIIHEYNHGGLTQDEKYNKVVDVWTVATNTIGAEMQKEISYDTILEADGEVMLDKERKVIQDDSFNPIFMMSNSGARGNKEQMRQLAGMRGLMAKPSGAIIETPIEASFRDGLSVLQYFTSTHGARKGLADTALKTANSGYLTRRLVDVVQDVIVSEMDCNTVDGMEINLTEEEGTDWKRKVVGRVLLRPVDLDGSRLIFLDEYARSNEESNKGDAEKLWPLSIGHRLDEDLYDPDDLTKVLLEKGKLLGYKEVALLAEKRVASITVSGELVFRDERGIQLAIFESAMHRVLSQDVVHPDNPDTVILTAGTKLTEKQINILRKAKVNKIYTYTQIVLDANILLGEEEVQLLHICNVSKFQVRSPLTCHSEHGICALCYGRDLARRHLVNIGETVGIIAAQSIGEPGTQLTMRTFHIGGTASGTVEKKQHEARTNGGKIDLERVQWVINRKGEKIVTGTSGKISIIDQQGRASEKYNLQNGAVLRVNKDDIVSKGQILATWDPYQDPFIYDGKEAGVIKFTNIEEGETVQTKTDSASQQTHMIVSEYRSAKKRPSIRVCSKEDSDKLLKRGDSTMDAEYILPVGTVIMVKEDEEVLPGDMLARRPRETSKTHDIVGGLPRVAELFEVRRPKDMAVVSEIEGEVQYEADFKGKRRLKVVNSDTGDEREYLIPKGKHIIVADGDPIDAGGPLTEGHPELHDILHASGVKSLAKHLVDGIQKVYQTQGVGINDKHIEVIVRQMLRKVTIIDAGGTSFLVGEQVDRMDFREENLKMLKEGRMPATAKPLVLGITQASLTTSSFISAASFQETTKVLTEAALKGKMDYLRGLKENVIVGRLIPAGTGYREYVAGKIEVPNQQERPDKFLEDIDKPLVQTSLRERFEESYSVD